MAQAFDAQVPLFLRFVVLCSYLRAACMVSCRWAKRGRRSAAVEEERATRRLLGDGCKRSRNETSCSGQFSSSVGELLLTGSESSPLVLLPVSDLGSVDLHPCRPRTEKSSRKSRVNLGQSEVRKNMTKPALQTSRGTGERQHSFPKKIAILLRSDPWQYEEQGLHSSALVAPRRL